MINIIITFILYILALINPFNNTYIQITFYIISYLIVGFKVIKTAVKNLFKGDLFDECFLMSIATLGAIAIGEFPEAVAVMLLYSIGELFQDYAVNKSRDSISDLMDIKPDSANVIRNGVTVNVKPQDVEVGETLIIKPGEKVPLDGIILEGDSMIDTKAITGESVPYHLKENDTVLSGTINQNGILKVKVTKPYHESTVSKILDLVENATEKKSKTENFITKFSKIYTTVVIILAILIIVLPSIFIKDAVLLDLIYKALSFLVVSCPCALVISVPLSFFGGIGGASRLGILVKGSDYLEKLAKTDTVVFDKTGTLTKGTFEVQKINGIGMENNDLLEIVSYAENYSNHPIALSIKKAYNGIIDETRIENVKEYSGLGIKALVDKKEVLVGSKKFLEKNRIKVKSVNEVGTILFVSINKLYVGYILISDEIKPDSYKLINELKHLGIKTTVMLTGDRYDVANSVRENLQINRCYSELLPDGKVEKMEYIKSKADGNIAFVGDGINDSPALAISDTGIAMGAFGSDAAIEAADVVIMTDEPLKVASLIKISKKTMRIAKQNVFASILIKIIILILIALGISSMWGAVFADVGVTILATLNALRMLNIKSLDRKK